MDTPTLFDQPKEEPERKGPALRKLYYSIGEVAEMFSVPSHVLRYWESEFPQLHPKKGKAGNRLFQEKDLRVVRAIRTLLYEQKFTVAGARTKLDEVLLSTSESKRPVGDIMDEVKFELRCILDMLKR